MKLKPFNSETCVSAKSEGARPYIGIDTEIGTIRINGSLSEKLKLKVGDKLSFHQDEETPGDWYLLAGDSKGFEMKEQKKVKNGLTFNNSSLARKIAASVEFAGRSGHILLGIEPVVFESKKYWPLITSALHKAK